MSIVVNSLVIKSSLIIGKKVLSVATGGSMSFSGASTSNLSIPNDADFRFGTGNFTIEWFQYLDSTTGSFPRVFSIGTYAGPSIAVSLEGSSSSRIFYFWGSGALAFGTISSGLNNTWNHFAITRDGTNLKVFRNGTQFGTTRTNSTDFNNTTFALRIGNETSVSSAAAFKGQITDFRWVKGVALYTSNFVVPTAPLSATPETKLLLLATDAASVSNDSSGNGKVVTNNSVAYSSTTPFS